MKIHCFQHVSFETPGTITEWAEANDHSITCTYLYNTDFPLPDLTAFDMLLVMGGYMNVDEEEKFPWLKKEKAFIKECADAGKKIIGICLGAQLVACVFRCHVYAAKEKEIGFFPVQFSSLGQHGALFDHFTKDYMLYHWHGDTFDLPEDARLVASTDSCRNQVFMIGMNILCMQFHLEMTEEIIEELMTAEENELKEKGTYIQSAAEMREGFIYLEQNKKDLFLLLDKFCKE